jgi:hypothetical protein
MNGIRQLNVLLNSAIQEFPDFKIRPKSNSLFMKSISIFLKILTFGKNTQFMDNYYTTIGHTIYVPNNYNNSSELERVAVIRHELVHMRQARKYSQFIFSILYLFIIFPIGLAYFRAKFEKEAYEESMRARAEFYGMSALDDIKYKQQLTGHFTSSDYLWMWPFPKSIEKWYGATVEKLRKEISP